MMRKEIVEQVVDAKLSEESECEDAPEELGNEARHSTKRAFAALALSPLLEYGADYQLLYFVYVRPDAVERAGYQVEAEPGDGSAASPDGRTSLQGILVEFALGGQLTTKVAARDAKCNKIERMLAGYW